MTTTLRLACQRQPQRHVLTGADGTSDMGPEGYISILELDSSFTAWLVLSAAVLVTQTDRFPGLPW